MRYARVAVDGRELFAAVHDDHVIELTDVRRFGEVRDGSLTSTGRGEPHPLSAVTFLPPVIPPTFYAAGFNYRAHNRHHEDLGYDPVKVGPHPEVGYRAQSALIGHGAAIVKPDDIEGRFETEAEVVAVIGRTLRHASRDEAHDGIFGWTIGNDVSARAWQHSDRTLWRAKNADTFKPMGPWIETEVDPLKSSTTVRRNGAVDAQFATGDMIFDPYDFIVEITKYITLSPGDVLWMGADGNTPMDAGDVIDIEISGIGTLTNHVVGAAAGTDAERMLT
ncbi:2-keto-4-pentenoate hydratase/2-oxohepta-3-ene-1,7-dioic acid hydratase (catechol pathway) [Microbacterium sp. cf046]|uniref:fumarylacetoacetate hydrolase family protein n=1 Tax=Microbacterium sp. cf046 TaxID=1761803 RepID=UPI0008F020A3|nr:fumarylacetoacetate hydrolase family protein [Microbacterium sp. cf046]SFR89627.1 2-keto-4-pentenoate hydratase/2-oxohepta-3-ene-1,7-dioic acid hydratase (catechol pathway) [Microbacterium sp. cf046]